MIFTLLILIGGLLAIYYLIGIYNETYWKKRGITFYPKSKVLGPMGQYITSSRPLFEIFNDIYKTYSDEPVVGIGSLFNPALFVKDPVNVYHVLTADFNSFSHRGFDMNEGDILANNVVFINGDRWKLIRQKMTPLFTATKLKSMYYLMDRSAQDFVDYLNKRPELLKGNAFNTLCTFTNAAVGAAVFGIENESIFESPFLKMALSAFRPTIKFNLTFAIGSLNARLYKLLNLTIFKDHEKLFIPAIKEVIRKREELKVKKHDFADLCVNLKSKGTMKDHDSGLELQPTDELLAAQAFSFYIAGVEPTGTAMFNILVELGRNPDSLKRLHKEIDDSFEKYNNEMTYDAIQEMEYLDMVHDEALRMHPPIGYLTRQCVKDTVLPVGNVKVEKGTKIFTPIYSIHHDPKFYTNPEVFNPERFSRENSKNINNNTFMPFGEGKRLCIGIRYGTLQGKAGLVHLLRHFTVKTNIKEPGFKYSKQTIQVRPTNVDVQFIPRNH
ncbi:PREDICTED: cytochrome P450 6B5-like [Papilio polytes]|uniref:cytochrome P450 6B5-like n=1 Tax=Papilio polytes TaxID=76194 RepID=UPI000675C456|nr:PREDICTED: cytochrome P450 6B5-like [Papilio polytes]